MSRWRVLLVLLLAALLPLLAPAAWLRGGAFPHAGVLVVVYVALHGGPAPAAWCGALLGLLAAPWTAAPLGETSFLLGSVGFATGAIRQALYRDRASVQIGLVAAAVLVVRVASAGLAGGVTGAVHALPGAVLSAGASALVAPPVFGLLGAARLFRRGWRSAAGV